ncbi:uncharacterized protein LOC123541687 isoform X6 [Mercenaria mercenaria]|uniref:uncharacterized protein LOC123541687 isoform X6 n=1 Tax=Mercenaria mercenaria TaxID=6596 RepID=UPI00234E82C9|nr:uncharacterized protein LOC123541687 isoform X6 [Mercenaria mercenaria]XP_045183141.2 uncharacterized protein LOC123541687 isoform X6 [Mercenaria mercenaria]
MNSYIARNIFNELQDSIRRFCRCPQKHYCARFCAASGTAVVIPIAFWLQFSALMRDQWAYKDGPQICFFYNGTLNCTFRTFGCVFQDYWDKESRCLCALEITSVVLMGLLMLVGFCVCCRTCCRSITVESCKVCYVCILSLMSLIPGILNLCCCFVTVKFVSEHKEKQLTFGFSFYAYTVIGSATLVISLASVCGYICGKTCELREDYETQIGSDECEASLLSTN